MKTKDVNVESLERERESNKLGKRGITLIALIITIIILLILAGVTINILLGENGILRQAEIAGKKYENATKQEQHDLNLIMNEVISVGSNRDDVLNNEFFYFSKNGFMQTIGKSTTSSLFGLEATEYEPVVEETGWGSRSNLEKDIYIDLSKDFEVSFKNKLITGVSNMGGVDLILQSKSGNGHYEELFKIRIADTFGDTHNTYLGLNYKGETIKYANWTSDRVATYGLVGDGENIKFYCDDTLLATVPKEENMHCDKMIISFIKYTASGNYPPPIHCALEQLYVGPIKYYKDII